MSDSFLTFRTIHMSCAALSIIGFIVRWIWMLSGSHLPNARVTKIVPHIVDTVLLLSAIALVTIIGFNANAAWLSAKIAGLVVYIVLGTFALKRGRTKTTRFVCGVMAIIVFAFITSVARTHDPLGFCTTLA
ncbi:SirB2 protein [Candidatus Burkholderia pumila]|uniref:SirB2 protein n=1 Tax=Candidatus Burkholderia pumila TaxID=1090375 RepID=A0ABR5HK01_9BURK|nr:SirB2 protein [Candidatus Burkholderia pumila]